MSRMETEPAVSVILPVYNVGAYLDVCMESLLRQTFGDMEILLVDDGSTDDSLARCLRWQRTDPRVRVLTQPNRGVAAARNRGLDEAKGRYLAFVDPDDWVEDRYLEKLVRRLEETGADFAECDLWRYDNRTGRKIYRSCCGPLGMDDTLEEHMKYGPTALYKSVYRRELWEKNGIRLPGCSFESPAVYALLVALAGRVVSVREALYDYRRFRENSLVETGYAKDGKPDSALGVAAMRHLISEFRRLGLYEQYRETLEGVVRYRLSDILAMQFHRRSRDEFAELEENCRRFLEETFPGERNERCLTVGGYNLNRVLTNMNRLHSPDARFNFSGLIALTEERKGTLPPFRHRNRYREIMLERERTGAFFPMLSAMRPKWLFLNLVEDRFDAIETEDGFLTASDAWEGADARPEGRRIAADGAEWAALWDAAAARFAARLRACSPGTRLVILEDVLSETVGGMDAREPFPDLAAIRKTNARLMRCYRRMEALCPDALVYRPAGDPLYFTDRAFEYGAVPSHLNERYNRRAAQALEALLSTGGTGGHA